MENTALFNKEMATQIFRSLKSEPGDKISLLIGPEDSGKSRFLKWMGKEISENEDCLVLYHEIFPHEHPSHFLCRFFIRLLNGRSLISSTTRWEDIKKQLPGEGGFINVLFEQDIRPFKFRLLEAFNFIASSNLRKKLFWIIDSCPTLESEEIFSFFAELKEKLPANVKIIIGQREGDILSRNRNVFSPFVFSVANENEKREYVYQRFEGVSLPDDLIEKTISRQNSILGIALAIHLFDKLHEDFTSRDVSEMFGAFSEKADRLGVSKILDWLSIAPFFVSIDELSALTEFDDAKISSLINDPFLSPFIENENNKMRIANNRLCSIWRRHRIHETKDASEYLQKYFLYLYAQIRDGNNRDEMGLKEDVLRCSYLLQNIHDGQFFLKHSRGLFDVMSGKGLFELSEEILKKAIFFQKDASYPLRHQADMFVLLGTIQCKQANYGDAISSYQNGQYVSQQIEDREKEAKFLSLQGQTFYLEGDTGRALEKHEEALRIHKELSNYHEMASEYGYIGKIYNAMEKFSEGETYFREAIRLFEAMQSESENGNEKEAGQLTVQIASLYSALGNGYLGRGELDSALENHQKSLILFEKIGDETGCSQQWGYLGHVQYEGQKLPAALDAYQNALRGYKKDNDRPGVALILSSLGHVHSAMGNLDQSLRCHRESLGLQKEFKNLAGEADQLSNMGKILQGQMKIKEAVGNFEEAVEIRQELQDMAGVSAELINLAETYLLEENLDRTHKYYQAALTVAKESGNSRDEAEISIEIGNLFKSEAKYREAETYYDQALRIHKIEKDREKEASVLGHMGMLKRIQKKNEEALKYFQEGLAILKDFGHQRGIAHFIANIGVVYYDRNDHKEALNCYTNALTLYRDFKDPEGTANVLSNIATLHYHEGDMDLAAHNYEEALNILRNIKHILGVANLLRNLSYVYRKQEKYDLAFNALEETIKIFESVKFYAEAEALKEEAEDIEKKAAESLDRLRREIALARPPQKKETTGRNDPCPCGSGKKYKRCCG